MIFEVLEKINCKEFLIKKGFSRNVFPIIKYNLLNNGKKIKLIDDLEKGNLELKLSEFESDIISSNESIDIVYEDDYILIVNKPSNLCIMPNHNYLTNNLSSRIINYYRMNNIKSTVHVLTRLDRQTRGLVFIVKHKELCSLFKIDEKRYYCVCDGVIKENGFIEANIKKSDDGIRRIISDDGKYSKTYYWPIKSINNTLLDVLLETGRTHQIRLHLSHIGHPILGDELYGSGNNLLLECYYLGFYHPFLNKKMEIRLEIDKEFLKYL